MFTHHMMYGYHGYHGYHGYGPATDWLTHIVLSSVIHALIYGLMHELTLGQAAVLVIVILVLCFAYARSRDRARW
jgi:membrane protease YdiL (CAAX protease family)